ncbi:hypothetical protein ASZ90_005069 [hydrocarbon metagenome]|uniref:Glycosyltransferase n=1 Tax=hydrocarbon metagenome TaxID=938273 RepID=A0A0W8FW92_9ZZZZ
MKVLLVGRYNPSEVLTGPEKFAKRLYHNLLEHELDCEFVEYFFDGTEYSVLQKLFGKQIKNFSGVIIKQFGIISLLFYLVVRKPDIIHFVTFERFQIIVLIFKILTNVKLIYTVHGIIVYENQMRNEYKTIGRINYYKDLVLEKLIFQYANAIVFLSNASKKLAKNYYDFSNKRSVIIYHGVDKYFLRSYDSKTYNSSTIKAVSVGDYSRREKGLTKLLEILDKSEVNVELHMISNDEVPFLNRNNLIVHRYDKMNSVDFKKFLIDKDIFISASNYEPFSISALESISSGLIPFFTTETGLSEITSQIDCGFYFKYSQLDKINAYLKMYSSNKSLYHEKGIMLHKFVKDFTWYKTANSYSKLYSLC